MVDELHAMGIATLGGPSDSGKAWEWEGTRSLMSGTVRRKAYLTIRR